MTVTRLYKSGYPGGNTPNVYKEYSDALRRGHGAYLLEQDEKSQDNFIINVGALPTDRDILLDIKLANNHSNSIVAVEPGAVITSFTPIEQDCQHARNNLETTNQFVFIIDCGGSMQDENKIGLAREAMLLFLKSLPFDCHFNIIRFGSNHKTLFNEITVVKSEENARKAEQLFNQLQADLGGTEILRPLQWLEERSPWQGRSRQIFMMTDGEISNVNQVLGLCRSMATSPRIFSFDLGQSPSRSLVKGNNVMNAPAKMPPVYASDRLIVYVLVNDQNVDFDYNSSVEFRTEGNHLGAAKIDYLPNVDNNGMIARLAPKALILELQHANLPPSVKNNNAGSFQSRFQQNFSSTTPMTTTDEKEITKKMIIELSLKYRILSSHTAFIGVEKRTNASNDDMVLCEIPIQISTDDQHLEATLSSASFQNSSMALLIPKCETEMKQRERRMAELEIRWMMGREREMKECASSMTTSASRIKMNKQCTQLIPPRLFNGASWRSNSKRKDNSNSSESCADACSSSSTAQYDLFSVSPSEQNSTRQVKFEIWSTDDIEHLTGKPLESFSSSIDKQILVSAIVIVACERRFTEISTMWHGVVQKARKQFLHLLTNDVKQLESLLENIRQQL
ncbi:unnamed protein product [Rotaria magnacalcarata]|uniref:VWFA domain-containing protein n=1 Tax=Rotaria magnacalcarata TaxID=392030 RepID=A0A8S2KXW8_9BILA|nr:unnamed protein product [Rotaria magnacalcarata]